VVCERDVETLDPIEKTYLDLVEKIREEEKASLWEKESGSWKGVGAGTHKTLGAQKRLKKIFRKESGTWERYWSEWPMELIGWYDGDLAVATEYEICDGSAGTPDLIDSFPRSESAHGSQSGSDTHTPAANGITTGGANGVSSRPKSNKLGGATNYTHTHPVGSHSHGSADHKPEYLALQPVVINGKCRAGLTLWYRGNTAPTGWQLRADADGKYLRGKNGTGTATGGSATHSHYQSISTGGASGWNSHSLQSRSDESQHAMPNDHTHSYNHYANGPNDPQHIELSVIEATSDDSQPESGMVGILKGTRVPSGWHLCNGADGSPDYLDCMIKANNGAYSDLKTGNDTHTDESPAGYTGYTNPPEHNYSDKREPFGGGSYSFVINNHRHYVGAHNHGAANDNLPVHTPVLLIIKL